MADIDSSEVLVGPLAAERSSMRNPFGYDFFGPSNDFLADVTYVEREISFATTLKAIGGEIGFSLYTPTDGSLLDSRLGYHLGTVAGVDHE
ncbi:hypothetical protein [uncultured Roseobacter sp.]|uniref:hypothetical protein n=1 Tax=uncultured Roseobacter sp. TaxID=114847 RepID=UPI00260E0D27|nr:hypothetical protein [uncultured Roseobacter sp.]